MVERKLRQLGAHGKNNLTVKQTDVFESILNLRRNRPDELFGYWEFGGISNAGTERMNGVIKQITGGHQRASVGTVRARAIYRGAQPNIEMIRCSKCGNPFVDRMDPVHDPKDTGITITNATYDRPEAKAKASKVYERFARERGTLKFQDRKKLFADILPITLEFTCFKCANKSNQLDEERPYEEPSDYYILASRSGYPKNSAMEDDPPKMLGSTKNDPVVTDHPFMDFSPALRRFLDTDKMPFDIMTWPMPY